MEKEVRLRCGIFNSFKASTLSKNKYSSFQFQLNIILLSFHSKEGHFFLWPVAFPGGKVLGLSTDVHLVACSAPTVLRQLPPMSSPINACDTLQFLSSLADPLIHEVRKSSPYLRIPDSKSTCLELVINILTQTARRAITIVAKYATKLLIQKWLLKMTQGKSLFHT